MQAAPAHLGGARRARAVKVATGGYPVTLAATASGRALRGSKAANVATGWKSTIHHGDRDGR
jgi:hypothetical protein